MHYTNNSRLKINLSNIINANGSLFVLLSQLKHCTDHRETLRTHYQGYRKRHAIAADKILYIIIPNKVNGVTLYFKVTDFGQ